MFLRQALRYRWSQMLVLAGVSVLIGTCAAFAPWFSRAVEQTVTTETLSGQWLQAGWRLDAAPPLGVSGPSTAPPPEDLVKVMPDNLRPLFGPPSNGLTVQVVWGLGTAKKKIEGRVEWRDGYCGKVALTAGQCPDSSHEVVVSTTDAKNFGVAIGSTIGAQSTKYAGGGTLRVVGLYQADSYEPYWFGRGPTGEVWRLEEDLAPLLADCRRLLDENSRFLVLTVYAVRMSALAIGELVKQVMADLGGKVEIGEMSVREEARGLLLPTAIFARWSR